MSFLTILDTLLLGPLKLIFEIIFSVANRFIGHPGLAIIVLSLVMNILVLPLYKRADAMQEEARDTDAKLRDGVAHIKKTFSGDERMMILQTYYRQNNYKPTSALNGSVSLLLEVPFFMAAYQFLSHVESLNGISLGPIADLGAPDGLLVIGGLTINLLPIIMTLVNVVSSAIYLKGFPLKTKIQLYGMALFFLVFLYTSPSCLVFYWTLNNVFSLVKTIFYKLKNPRKVLCVLASAAGVLLLIVGLFLYQGGSFKRKLFLAGIGVLMQLPMVLSLLQGKITLPAVELKPNKKLFVLGGIFLTVLVGVLIPSTFIAASPQEYVDPNNFHDPLWYILSAGCLAAGTFLVWMGVFYWLASPKGKAIFDRLVWILCGAMLVCYMFFGTDLGVISSALQYERGLYFSTTEQVVNLLVLAVAAVALFLFAQKWSKAAATVLLTAAVALGGMSVLNMVTIKTAVDKIAVQDPGEAVQSDNMPHFELSKTGKNVVVIMLDRAMGEYVPYIFNEKPEIEKQFGGFTYYANTISFGGNTNFGAPALLGGYEYTPVELNKRDQESLESKHNEALKVMPVLFSENGYKVTVCDPVYAGYQWIPDLSIYDDYADIQTYNTKGRFTDGETTRKIIQNNYRNFFCFSLMKSVPLCVQSMLYNDGLYNQVAQYGEKFGYSSQYAENMSQAFGMNSHFMESYNVLDNMTTMTRLTEEGTNTFLFLENEMTHEPMLLQEPDYTPAEVVDNTAYDAANAGRFTVDGVTLNIETAYQMSHYQTNLTALRLLGNWFDYLRENGVYDNTRIILVSDHGNSLGQIESLIFEDGTGLKNGSLYFPLLMVKDFDSQELAISREFMTNADVPTLATQDLIENPVNPFTGNPINSDEKTAHDQFVIVSREWDVLINNGNTFLPAGWAAVKNDLWEEENWTFYNEETVLKEHKAP